MLQRDHIHYFHTDKSINQLASPIVYIIFVTYNQIQINLSMLFNVYSNYILFVCFQKYFNLLSL